MSTLFSINNTSTSRFFLIFITLCILFVTACQQSSLPVDKSFNSNWQFTISDSSFKEIIEDKNWEAVSLPHSPVIEPKVMKGQWQGICWYRKTFQLPHAKEKQRYILRFEGAMNASEFWINEIKVASHQGGYLPVTFDFTDVANVGGDNQILVRLDNTDNTTTGPKPMSTLDFNMYGGLYRNARLIVKSPVHISDPILANKVAGGGIFVTYPKVTKDKAVVQVKTNVVNHSVEEKHFTVKNELWKDGHIIQSAISKKILIEKNTDADVIMDIQVKNPALWSPKSPNLYDLKTIVSLNEKVVDMETTRIGIRRIKITADCFKINGGKMFLRGVNRHQDYPYIGYALSDNAQYRDALKIKEAGFDYIRLSHYPHSPAFMSACDELGLVVIDAILGWQYYSNDSSFIENRLQACRDLIRRDRNHPSVIAWELSLNESWMDTSFIDPAHAIGHEEYPGDQTYTAGWQKYGYDIYLQARQHRLGHYKKPGKPYVVSEYGDWEYYAMNAGLNQDAWGDLMQEERSSRQLLSDGEIRLLQQATNIQESHNDNMNTPAFADGYWVMFDYNRGYSDDLEASGIMSIDRRPKFSYYFYQSQRAPSEVSDKYQSGPMVHVASWWTPESPLDIRVYSNAGEVELFLNGKSLGKQKPDNNATCNNLQHPPFTFHADEFKAGELLAKAYIGGKVVAEHRLMTPGSLTKIELTIDDSDKPATAGCNDVLFVHAILQDTNGTIVRENGLPVTFSVEGDVELISPAEIPSEAGISTALLRFGESKGRVIIKAVSDKLEKELVISTRPETPKFQLFDNKEPKTRLSKF